MKTVKMKMTLLFGVLAMVICAGVAAASFYTSEKSLIEKSQNSMKELAILAGKAVDAKLNNYLDTLDSLSYCGIFSSSLETDGNAETVKEALKTEASRGGYLHVALANTDGTALYESGNYMDLKNTDYFKRAMSGEKVVTEPVFFGEDGLVMIYAVPVQDKGKTAGVLIGIRDGFELGNLAGDSANGKTGSAFIINEKGNTIAHSNKEMMQQIVDAISLDSSNTAKEADAVSAATQEVDAASSATADQQIVGENLLGYGDFAELQQAMVEGRSGYGQYVFEDTDKILGYAPVVGRGWSVGLEIDRTEALTGISQLMHSIILIGGIFLCIALVIVYFVTRQFTRPIEYFTEICYRMSTGDYTAELDEKYNQRKDEMGRLGVAFRAIIDSTKALLQENMDVSKQISESSQKLDYMIQQFTVMMKEISSAVDQIAAGNLEQAEGTQKGAQRISDMEKLIEKEEQNMLGLHKASDKVDQLKEEGFTILNDLVKKTEASSHLSEEIYQVFRETNESAGKISDISNMIGGITNQTKLLALNASIEAARAGEHGKGFSVVAAEVETLAESADKLSKEIAELVEELSNKTTSSITKMEKIKGTVMEQTKSAEMTQLKFKGIAEAIGETRVNIEILNQTIEDMSYKKDEVVNIIMDLSAASEENASGTEEVSVSVQEQTSYLNKVAGLSSMLSEMAEQMDEYTKKYRI